MRMYARDSTAGHDVDVIGAWAEVVGDRELESGYWAEYGFAEEVIGILHFKDGTFEVGIGEPLRPYQVLYAGSDFVAAQERFWQAVRLHTQLDLVEDEGGDVSEVPC